MVINQASTQRRRAMDTNRLAKELREIQADTKSGVTVTVIGDDLGHMQGTILGEWGRERRRAPTKTYSRTHMLSNTPNPPTTFFVLRPHHIIVIILCGAWHGGREKNTSERGAKPRLGNAPF